MFREQDNLLDNQDLSAPKSVLSFPKGLRRNIFSFSL